MTITRISTEVDDALAAEIRRSAALADRSVTAHVRHLLRQAVVANADPEEPAARADDADAGARYEAAA